MADRIDGQVAFTPIVTLADDADADGVDTIHHDIKQALSGTCTYNLTSDNAGDKWYYAPNIIATTVSRPVIVDNDDVTDLDGASGDPLNPNEAAGVAAHFTEGGDIQGDEDILKFVFIKNTGTSDAIGTKTTNSVYFCVDNGAAAYNAIDSIEIAPGEATMLKLSSATQVEFLNCEAGAPLGAGAAVSVNGSTNVRVTVVAVINDASV